MRRIPRPLRAIDPSLPLHSAIAPCTHLRTSTAAFSSTASNAFLLPAAKQDKKKHQQFVKKWQKRLLGDSEPIGAHVDPYDPTSPVRIAPEEQGEYEEVLDDADATRAGVEPGRLQYDYVPAQGAGGGELMHIGSKHWVSQMVEGDRAKEFEKLTLRTYTPLTLEMADEIEELTGTPYTLRDDNLMMAQTVHEVTRRPYTTYQFGLQRMSKMKNKDKLSHYFAQAVAEVYALKDAGAKLDLASSPNRGIYDVPPWVKDIKLCRTETGNFVLAYPANKSAKQFLQAMQMVPELEAEERVEEQELLLEEAQDLLEPVLPSEPSPTMDPATPAFKRAAMVKQDPDKKPFDFMSNRPVPRVKPFESEKVVEKVEADTPVVEPTAPSSRIAELASAFETSQTAVDGLGNTIRDLTPRKAKQVAVLPNATGSGKVSSSAAPGEEVKWRHVPLTSIAIKFALFKRVYQLTGIRVSDPHLSSSQTLGDLYDHLCAAAKPQSKSLLQTIKSEGNEARRRANKQARAGTPVRQKANLGDLIHLGNVELRARRPTKKEIRIKTGLNKVYNSALAERGLKNNALDEVTGKNIKDPVGVVEGTRKVPSFGRVLSSKGAAYLEEQTRKRKQREEEAQRTTV